MNLWTKANLIQIPHDTHYVSEVKTIESINAYKRETAHLAIASSKKLNEILDSESTEVEKSTTMSLHKLQISPMTFPTFRENGFPAGVWKEVRPVLGTGLENAGESVGEVDGWKGLLWGNPKLKHLRGEVGEGGGVDIDVGVGCERVGSCVTSWPKRMRGG